MEIVIFLIFQVDNFQVKQFFPQWPVYLDKPVPFPAEHHAQCIMVGNNFFKELPEYGFIESPGAVEHEGLVKMVNTREMIFKEPFLYRG